MRGSCLASLLVLALPAPAREPTAPPASTAGVDARLLGAAGYAKIVCSAVFVSGREVEEARRNSTFFLATEEDRAAVATLEVDRARREVRAVLRDGRWRRARFLGDQGCAVVPDDGEIRFRPVPVRSALPDAASLPWPMGDAPEAAPWPRDVDRMAVEAAVGRAFRDPGALTAALVVVHRGRILAERYAPGIGKDTQLES